MNQKIISKMISTFKIAYPYYFKELNPEELLNLYAIYQEELGSYTDETLIKTTKSIITTSKFMPSLKEIIDECEKNKGTRKIEVIEKMVQDGYFKSPMEIDKTYKFIEDGTIPNWLLKDMQKYGYNEEILMIGDKRCLIE